VLNYNHVYYFHVAASEGSVARAADRLGVTQPTVSEQIRQLERSVGVVLFERTSSGLRLTEAGRQAYEHTTSMFRAGERLVEVLGHHTAVPVGLRVGITGAVSRTVASDFLMPVLTLDDCLPTVRGGDYADLLRDLCASELDLLICETEPLAHARRGLELVTLTRPRLVAVANPAVAPAPNWSNVALVTYRPGSPYRWHVDAFLDDRGLEPRVAAEADDALLVLEAAARGGFVGVVPRGVARDAIAAGRVTVLADVDAAEVAVHALYRNGQSTSLARRAVDLLAEHARGISDA
jgi:LysR family transcriptional regulator, transcriptional activator of nhaA